MLLIKEGDLVDHPSVAFSGSGFLVTSNTLIGLVELGELLGQLAEKNQKGHII